MLSGRSYSRIVRITAAIFVAGAIAPTIAGDLDSVPIPTDPPPRITLVRIDKSDRQLELMDGETVVRTYAIALGTAPIGHKQQQGDRRTPEGRYVLDWRNPDSLYYRSIHVSYPNDTDRATAAALGVDPGGDIMIHGQPNGFGALSPLLQMRDWTHGCIAVTNEHMAEIWDMVENGTPIEINP